jgi:hypothetical protein
MKISLRKANAIQLLINEQINEPFSGSTKVSKFDSAPQEVLSKAGQELVHKMGVKFNLIAALFSIRKKVASKSAEVGVAALLTDLAENEKKTAYFKQLASSTPAPKFEVVIAALEDIKKEQTVNSYRPRVDSVEVSLVDQKSIDDFKKSIVELRKEKQKISDKLLHLNVSSEIELDEAEVAVLTNYDIL